jgi:hypothetical protein
MTPATAPANWCPVCHRKKKSTDPHEGCQLQLTGPKLIGGNDGERVPAYC